MVLNYKEIREATKKANELEIKKDIPLTEKEINKIQYYIDDMEEYIKDLSANGKDRFFYDCSKIAENVFYGLAKQFKKQNPLFFVTTESGIQRITIEWSGKNEV